MAPTPKRKKISRFTFSSGISTGLSSAQTTTSATMMPSARRASRVVPTRKSWMKPTTIISAKPTGRAAARQELTMPSAGVITQDSSSAKIKGRADDEDEEGQRCRDRHEVEQRPRPGRHHADEGGHPHVLAAAQRHDRAEHGEPNEEDRGELVRPDERVVQRIAPDDAGEQHDDLDDDEDRRRELNHAADGVVQPLEPGNWRAPLGLGAELGDGRGFAGNAHATSSFMFWLVRGQPSAELAGDLLQQLPGGIAVLRAPSRRRSRSCQGRRGKPPDRRR